MSDLRERVARAICDTEWGQSHYDGPTMNADARAEYLPAADAVIALVLEEAVQVAFDTAKEALAVTNSALMAGGALAAAKAIHALQTKTAEPSTTQSP